MQILASTDITLPEIDLIGWGAIAIAALAIGVILRKAWKVANKIDLFYDDWYGRPAENGHTAVPGMVERVSGLETTSSAMQEKQAEMAAQQNEMRTTQLGIHERIDHELTRNNGSSMKDAAFDTLRLIQELQIAQENEIIERAGINKELIDHIAKDERERHRLIVAVRQMIGMTEVEQRQMWDQILADYAAGVLGQGH